MLGTKLKPMVGMAPIESNPLWRFYRLESQFFSERPLLRAPLPSLHDDKADKSGANVTALRQAVEETGSSFMLFHKGAVGVVSREDGKHGLQIAWQPWKKVQALGLHFRELGDQASGSVESTLVLLGRMKGQSGSLRFAVNLTNSETDSNMLDDVKFVAPRSLFGELSRDDMAVVGQCISRLNWHNEMKFNPTTGAITVPAGGGHRRRDESTGRNMYPRTDPVAIMLVQSKDGKKCLLGQTARRHNSNVYSCLAGFVEQCESVEEACRREVFEEAGVVVSEVQVVGTQPWPMGAAGHCELMIGCIARADTDVINFDRDEMADVQWFSRKEALQMLERSKDPSALKGSKSDPFAVPPNYAIAHSLIKAWATNDTWKERSNFSLVHSTCFLGAGVIIGAVLARSLL